MREHRRRLRTRTVHLTFDLERDYAGTGEYINPPSFEGIKHNVPRVLDEMHEHDASGTFFLTPEVLAECEDLVQKSGREMPRVFTRTRLSARVQGMGRRWRLPQELHA